MGYNHLIPRMSSSRHRDLLEDSVALKNLLTLDMRPKSFA